MCGCTTTRRRCGIRVARVGTMRSRFTKLPLDFSSEEDLQSQGGHFGRGRRVSAIVINDLRDLHRLDATWSALRRTDGQVQLTAPALAEKPRVEIERDLNASLEDCGCHEGAVGVVVFSLLATAGLLMPGRRRPLRRSRGPSATMWLVWRAAAWIGGCAVVGGALGKAAGLAAARSRFARHRRRLRAELESIDRNGVR